MAEMISVRKFSVIFNTLYSGKVLPVCPPVEKGFPCLQELFLGHFCSYISAVPESKKDRHLVGSGHAGPFQKTEELSCRSCIEGFLFLCQVTGIMQKAQIVAERIVFGTPPAELIDAVIHAGKKFHPGGHRAHFFFDASVFPENSLFSFQPSFLHTAEKVYQAKVKVYETVIQIFVLSCPYRACACMGIISSGEQSRGSPCLFVVSDKVQHGQIVFSPRLPKSSAQLLKKDYGRFRGSEEEDHIHRRDIQAFIEHIHGKDDPELSFRKQPDGCLPVQAVFAFLFRPAEYGGGRNSPFAK